MTSARHDFGAQKMVRPIRQDAPRAMRDSDPLPALLTQLLKIAGQPTEVEKASSRPWASALFEGRRHIVTLRLDGLDAGQRTASLTGDLDDRQFPLSGHFVADINLDAHGVDKPGLWITLSVLTIRDW